jgi:hypothetical protein
MFYQIAVQVWLYKNDSYNSNYIIIIIIIMIMIIIIIIIFSGSAAQRGLWPPRHTRFLDHTQRRATLGRTSLDE